MFKQNIQVRYAEYADEMQTQGIAMTIKKTVRRLSINGSDLVRI